MKKQFWVTVVECHDFYGQGVHVDGMSPAECAVGPHHEKQSVADASRAGQAHGSRQSCCSCWLGVVLGEFEEHVPRAGPASL